MTRRVVPGERITPAEKALLIGEIIVAYARVRWWLHHNDLGHVVAATRACRAAEPCREPGSLEERLVSARLGNAVGRTLAVLPTDGRCLQRTLVLSRLLSARGLPGKVVIGARTGDDGFGAHAWLEQDGRPLLVTHDFDEHRLLEL